MDRSNSESRSRKDQNTDIKVLKIRDLYCLTETYRRYKNNVFLYTLIYIGELYNGNNIKLSITFQHNSYKIAIIVGEGDCEEERDYQFKTGKQYIYELPKNIALSQRQILPVIANALNFRIDNIIYFTDL